jgi:glycosyltransferase involved in cell wall biosynthesis
MKTSSPRVSIGLPVYNGMPFLVETLESLLAQTYADFELLISDNASTDETEKICRAYAARDARIRYSRQERNRGAAWNYNYVFNQARGAYLKWAAADDLCAPEFLARCVAVLDREPEVVVCYPQTVIIDAHGNPIDVDHQELDLSCPSARARFLQLMRLLQECNAVFGLIRAEVLRKTRLIGNYIASDVCLLAELSLHGKFFQVPEYLFLRRDHPEASSRKKSIELQMEFFDPTLKAHVVLPKWRRLYENAVSVERAPISWRDKVFLFGFLGYSVLLGHNGYGTELTLLAQKYAQFWRRSFHDLLPIGKERQGF